MTGLRHPLDVLRYHVTGAVERGEAQAITEIPVNKTWTTFGFWYNDEPVAVATVEGRVAVIGGGTVDELGDSSFQGAWATSGEAPDAETAEAMNIAEMESTLDDDESEDPYDPTADDGTVAHDGLDMPSYGS